MLATVALYFQQLPVSELLMAAGRLAKIQEHQQLPLQVPQAKTHTQEQARPGALCVGDLLQKNSSKGEVIGLSSSDAHLEVAGQQLQHRHAHEHAGHAHAHSPQHHQQQQQEMVGPGSIGGSGHAGSTGNVAGSMHGTGSSSQLYSSQQGSGTQQQEGIPGFAHLLLKVCSKLGGSLRCAVTHAFHMFTAHMQLLG